MYNVRTYIQGGRGGRRTVYGVSGASSAVPQQDAEVLASPVTRLLQPDSVRSPRLPHPLQSQ